MLKKTQTVKTEFEICIKYEKFCLSKDAYTYATTIRKYLENEYRTKNEPLGLFKNLYESKNSQLK